MKLTRKQVAGIVGDFHVYGGVGLASVGLGLWIGPPAGMVLFGTFTAWLGLALRGRKT